MYLLENLISGEVVKTVNGAGFISLVMEMDKDDPGADILPWSLNEDMLLDVWRRDYEGKPQPLLTGFLRGWTIQEGMGGRYVLTLRGPGVGEILERRIVAYKAGTAEADKTDQADDMMKEIVRENLGADAHSSRDLSGLGFIVDDDLSLGVSMGKAFSFRNVQTVLEEISEASAVDGTPVYFAIETYLDENGKVCLEFKTYINQPGLDRTGGQQVVFGDRFGNVELASLTYSALEEKNYYYAGGQGEGEDRITTSGGMRLRQKATPYNLREVFVDARHLESLADLIDLVNGLLNSQLPRYSFIATLVDGPQARYGLDWGHGDKVRVNYMGYGFTGIVRNVRFTVNGVGDERVEGKFEGEFEAVGWEDAGAGES
jgi:hypothetical protein